eukprot:g43449.t1
MAEDEAPRRKREEQALEKLKKRRAIERKEAKVCQEESSTEVCDYVCVCTPTHISTSAPAPAPAPSQTTNTQDADSDDDDELEPKEDPLYDPEQDEKDETWVAKRRRGRHTDAILTCPACFAIVCSDCQRHTKYTSQFRAMFVQNCTVDKARQQRPLIGDDDPNMKYWVVLCSDCKTHIGVMDSDEVYHFHNVLESR